MQFGNVVICFTCSTYSRLHSRFHKASTGEKGGQGEDFFVCGQSSVLLSLYCVIKLRSTICRHVGQHSWQTAQQHQIVVRSSPYRIPQKRLYDILWMDSQRPLTHPPPRNAKNILMSLFLHLSPTSPPVGHSYQ